MTRREVTNVLWECDYCHSRYTSEDQAERCEKSSELLEMCKKYKPWQVYTIRSGSGTIYHITAKDVCFGNRRYTSYDDDSCLNRNFQIYSASSNDYYCVPENWELIQVRTFEELYKDLGLLPQFMESNWKRAPQDVRVRVRDIYNLEVAKVRKDRGCDRELAIMYIEKKKLERFSTMILEG